MSTPMFKKGDRVRFQIHGSPQMGTCLEDSRMESYGEKWCTNTILDGDKVSCCYYNMYMTLVERKGIQNHPHTNLFK